MTANNKYMDFETASEVTENTVFTEVSSLSPQLSDVIGYDKI